MALGNHHVPILPWSILKQIACQSLRQIRSQMTTGSCGRIGDPLATDRIRWSGAFCSTRATGPIEDIISNGFITGKYISSESGVIRTAGVFCTTELMPPWGFLSLEPRIRRADEKIDRAGSLLPPFARRSKGAPCAWHPNSTRRGARPADRSGIGESRDASSWRPVGGPCPPGSRDRVILSAAFGMSHRSSFGERRDRSRFSMAELIGNESGRDSLPPRALIRQCMGRTGL